MQFSEKNGQNGWENGWEIMDLSLKWILFLVRKPYTFNFSAELKNSTLSNEESFEYSPGWALK